MCGIAGIVRWDGPPDGAAVAAMAARLVHRGPDAEGFWQEGPVAFGHRRLSVIDVSTAANQPLHDCTGRYVVVFNGEIYNYRLLRAELSERGHRFVTQSDTEVLLEAYKRWGVDCLARLNGMFAFALWDREERRLLLARDRLGKKPLLYRTMPDGGIAFASEATALLEHPEVGRRLDLRGLVQYAGLGYVTSDACIVAGVAKLPAAHYLLLGEHGATAPVCYWDLAAAYRTKRREMPPAAAAEELNALLDDAVRLRTISDVPIGAFLSGGVDSAAVVAAMARAEGAGAVDTYSIGFREGSFDETAAARAAAEHLGVAFHSRILDPRGGDLIARAVQQFDEPFADTSIFPMYLLAGFAREQVTVALSGDGGDEVFLGYETYAADKLHRWLAPVPRAVARGAARAAHALVPVRHDKVSADYKLKRFLEGLALPWPEAHSSWRRLFAPAEVAGLLAPEVAAAAARAGAFAVAKGGTESVRDCHPLDQASYLDIKSWLVDDILVKVDRATMAHGLEARTPFLDHRIVEFAAALPPDLKLRGWTKKWILREAQKRYLPPATRNRRKAGFNAPIAAWLQDPETGLARTLAEPPPGDPFRQAAVDALLAEHRRHRRDNSFRLLMVATLRLWLARHGLAL